MPSSGWCVSHEQHNTTYTMTYSGIFSAFDFPPRCLFRGTICHVINNFITKLLPKYSPATSATFDFETQCLLQSRGCYLINNFIIWYNIHTKTITKLYSPDDRRNQQRQTSAIIFPPRPMSPWPNPPFSQWRGRETCQQRRKGRN